jgi:hypothetical protein
VAEPQTYTQEQYDAMIAERDALKHNRDEILKESKKAKDALKNYEGVDPVEFKTLKEAAAEAERKKALAEGNLEVWKKQVTDQHQKEREADGKKLTKALAALEKRKVAKLTAALAKAEADPTMMDLLVLKGSASVRLQEGDEDWNEIIADEKGNPLVRDGQGTPMDMDTFVAQVLKTQYPGAFKGTGSSGGGATKSTGSAGGKRTVSASDPQAFIRYAKEIASGEVEVVA